MIRKTLLLCAVLISLLSVPLMAESIPEPSAEPVAETPLGPDGLPALAPGLEQPEVDYKSCSAALTCHNGSYISCSQPSGTCTSVPSNCSSGQRGYVQCGSARTDCPRCDDCPGTLYCEYINADLYPPSVCPERCIILSDGSCGYCFSGPGPEGCICTE